MDAASDPRPYEPGPLVELSEQECWALLGSQPVGRLAWQGSEGLTVLPLNHRVVDGALELRTAAYSVLAREVDDSRVAFEVDQIDADRRAGWSVLVRGVATVGYDEPVDGPQPWAAGPRHLRVSVRPTSVTGRRVLPR